MSERDERFAKGYLEGYEKGLREAIQEFITSTSRKNFTTAEIRLLAKNQMASVPEKVEEMRVRLARKYGIQLGEREEEDSDLDVVPGRTYLVKEEAPMLTFHVAASLRRGSQPVLTFTRRPVEDVRSILGDDAQVFWLSKAEGSAEQGSVPREMIIGPTELTKMQTTYQRFLEESKDGTPVIVFDVLGYLLTQSDFQTVLKLLQGMRDHVYMRRSVLLVTYDPLCLRENQPRILEQEMR
jgi:hypothetical protein